ncbi:MAG: hypothetical protein ACI97R_000550 [Candidatus Azotimanducaceae bacterium]|jgi:hypothetical protein
MKKITFLMALVSSMAIAQQTSYTDTLESIENSNTTYVEATLERVDNNRMPIVATYTTLADFNTGFADECGSASDALTFEDMVGGPSAITPCGAEISSAGDGCFAAGELEDGFSVTASNSTDIIYIPAGAIGNTDPLVGAASFAEFTIITFTEPVYAVAGDIWENNEPLTIIRIYGAGDVLIDTFDATTPTNQQTFVGFIADEGITKIELEGDLGSGELFGNLYFGVDCDLLGTDTLDASIVLMYPNPATDIVEISVSSEIQIESITVTDVLGKTQEVSVSNNTINVSSLSRGLYIVTVKTNAGDLVQKLIKK